MNIVHFSITPLAGGPYRLVSVLRRETEHDVRLIDLKRGNKYPQDVVFEESVDEAVELARAADVIHLHNYIDLETKVFEPIDLRDLQRSGKAIVRQFRTSPETLAAKVGVTAAEIVNSDVPSIVIAQFHERYYPRAMVVPNAVPSQQPEYACIEAPVEHDICYSPSGLSQAWRSRWDTKGGPETIEMLREVQRLSGARCAILSGRPLHEVLRTKRASRMIIDDLVTGSYHASGLEGLCLGKAVLCHLDERTVKVLREVSGASDIPFINVRLEDAMDVLVGLMREEGLVRSIGRMGREWVDAYWSESVIAQRYCRIYEDLLADPARVRRQESLQVEGDVRKYFAVTLPDVVYHGRGKRYTKALSVRGRVARSGRQARSMLKQTVLRNLPSSILRHYQKVKPVRKG